MHFTVYQNEIPPLTSPVIDQCVFERCSNLRHFDLITIHHSPRSMARSLDYHLNTFPTKTHYELSQSGQPRTTLKNGELPCLATSSTYVWSKALDRTFSGKEKLRTLLFPLEKLSWTNLHTEGVLARMAGNGMFLPSVGWSMLAHILCVR